MMRKLWVGWLIVGLALGLWAIVPVQAQAGSPVTVWIDWVDVSAYPQVTVHLSAWDDAGLPLEIGRAHV